MLAAPADGITLGEKRTAIDALMRSGADIAALNCVRKHLSAIKGGRLALETPACVTLALSDVHTPEDDPATIASGPTVADPSSYADALRLIQNVDDVPTSVREHLAAGLRGERAETPKPGDPRLTSSVYVVIANRRTAMRGAAEEATRRGYVARHVAVPTCGEARDAGRRFAEEALAERERAGRRCVIASGETTVHVRGNGRGGRNQEFALGAAAPLAACGRMALLASVGSDGIDGPTDAAGAIATPSTIERLRERGLDVQEVLAANDAYPALQALGDLVVWGATGTNVGDLHVLLTM